MTEKQLEQEIREHLDDKRYIEGILQLHIFNLSIDFLREIRELVGLEEWINESLVPHGFKDQEEYMEEWYGGFREFWNKLV